MKRLLFRSFAIAYMLISMVQNSLVFCQPKPDSPLGRNERPRLLMDASKYRVVAARALGTHAGMYATLKSRADELLVNEPRLKSFSVEIFNTTAILALVAAIEKENGGAYEAYRDRAFYFARAVLDNSDPWTLTSKHAGASHNIRGQTGALSLVYDWLYADLPAELKRDIHQFLINVYKGLHNIERPEGVGKLRRSAYSSQYWLEWGAHPWFSIALYGDGEGDEAIIDDALDATRAEIQDYSVPALNMLGGALHSGWGYVLGDGDVGFCVMNLLAWEIASSEKIFPESFALKEFPKYFLHASKPDGSLIKIEDTNDTFADPLFPFATDKFDHAFARSILILLMDIYQDGYARYIVDKQDFRPSGDSGNQGWKNLIFYDDSIPTQTPSNLSHVRFFPQTGILLGRTGWSENDLYYTFRNSDQYGGHSDAKQNSFTIFHHGAPLAINDGNYPDGASGKPSTKSYLRRTISSNSVLVFDPSETFYNFAPAFNDGGQKFGDRTDGATGGYAGGWEPEIYDQGEFDASEYNTADNTFEDGSTFTYIKGDATRGYSRKCTRFVREFVHLKPSYFVIFDKVGSSDKAFKKKWLLHSITEPELNGTEDFSCSSSVGEAACQGDTQAGISKSYDSNHATITNNNGRLFVKTMLPANPVYRKIGGEGYRFWLDDANQNIPPQYYTPSVTGGWRLEISPQTPDDDSDGESLDIFLHVLYACEASAGSMAETLLLSPTNGNVHTANAIGVHIADPQADRIVVFNRSEAGAAGTESVSYTVSTTTSSRHYVFGLQPSATYSVKVDENVILQETVSEQGNLEFEYQVTGAYKYTVSRGTATEAGTGRTTPRDFSLQQNYPNPLDAHLKDARTRIRFRLKRAATIELTIFNILGKRVRTLIRPQHVQAGAYRIHWNGLDDAGHKATPGVYFYRLRFNGRWSKAKKLVVVE